MKSNKVIEVRNTVDASKFWSHMLTAIGRGKSMERAFMELSLAVVNVSGDVVDLGAGSTSPSYLPFIKGDKSKMLFTDYYRKDKGMISIDLEKPFKLKKKFNFIFCLNVFEHIFNSQKLMSSISKNLPPKGTAIISTPYLYQYHPSPKDFWRYTPESLEELAKTNNLRLKKVVYLGNGPFTAAGHMVWYVFPVFLRYILFLTVWGIDSILMRFSKMFRYNYALGYVFVLEKK